jgi:HD-GYP domain-containing protein (c-di-GMP phosphodiesterase class II)
MKEYKLDNLSPVISFSENVFLDEGFVIAAQEMPMGESRFKALRAWGCDVVFSDGIPMEISEDESFKKNRQLGEEYFNNDDAHHRAAGLFSRLLSFVTVCFEKASKGQKALYDDVAIQIKEICTQMRDNNRYLLQVQQEYRAATDSSYLEAHAVRAAILSIAIGMLLKLPAHRLIELGVAALLHEIGMAKLPASISMSTKQFYEK